MRLTQLHHKPVFVLSEVHRAGDHQVLAVGALTLAGGRVVSVWLRGETWPRGVVARAIARVKP